MRARGRALSGFAVIAFSLLAGSAVAAPGELDSSFGGGDGKSLIDLGRNDYASDVALQPDGKIVVSGGTSFSASDNGDIAVLRLLNPQGTLDPSYASGSGWSRLDFARATGGELALQPDGKILVTGSTQGPGSAYSFVVARLQNPEGTLDSSFASPDGFLISKYGSGAPSGAIDYGTAISLQPDQRILVAGTSNFNRNPEFAVARLLNPEGELDNSFGLGSGASFVGFGGTPVGYDYGGDVVPQPDGRIILAGYSRVGSAGNFGVARLLNPSGTPDPSFGGGTGKARIDFGGPRDYATSAVLQPDGKIIVVGRADSKDMGIARLLANGNLDGSFGSGGKAVIKFAGDSVAVDVELQPDGKIVVGGVANNNLGAARLQPNGALDTTFGNGGKVEVEFGRDDAGTALAVQPNGDIVIVGTNGPANDSNFAIARLQGGPPGAVKGKCAGKRATVIGTTGKDRLKGSRRKDVISAGKGRDTIKGLKGNDLICGGKGPDKLIGGPGKDKLLGEKGKDRLLGGPGKDRLLGGAAKDTLLGGPDKDRLKGGPGKDAQRQ